MWLAPATVRVRDLEVAPPAALQPVEGDSAVRAQARGFASLIFLLHRGAPLQPLLKDFRFPQTMRRIPVIQHANDFECVIKAARRVSTPLIAARTFDPASAIQKTLTMLGSKTESTPAVQW